MPAGFATCFRSKLTGSSFWGLFEIIISCRKNSMPIITTNIHESVVTISINRPDALNAINNEVMVELGNSIAESIANNAIKGIIITGSGEKAFVAGADIKELASLSKEQALALAQYGLKTFKSIEDCPKPVIAVVNGFALGGGCELAMACHMRIATENSKFGQPEVNLGIIPGYGGTQRLTQLVGRGKALELLLTADLILATEAKALGLVNHVVGTKQEALDLANKILSKITSKAPIAIENIIKSVNAGFSFENTGYAAESKYFSECSTTEDFKEGTAAFMAKRPANFKAR
jgi:enoyl-CoA hydratase